MVSQITGNLTACSTVCLANIKKTTKSMLLTGDYWMGSPSQKASDAENLSMPWCMTSLSSWTHCGRVVHICVSKLTWSVPSHYLKQCWNIVNWTPRNKLQWNFHRNSYIFIQENPFENGAILSRPRQKIWYWTESKIHQNSWNPGVGSFSNFPLCPQKLLNRRVGIGNSLKLK